MEQKIVAILARMFNKDEADLSGATLLKEDLNAKSMNYLEISATLEIELGVDIPLDRITKVKSIQDIFDIVQEQG